MAFSEALAERIRQRMARRKYVEQKKMFGGSAFSQKPPARQHQEGLAGHSDCVPTNESRPRRRETCRSADHPSSPASRRWPHPVRPCVGRRPIPTPS
jgi:hypothetical protein